MTSKIKVVILYLWLGEKDEVIRSEILKRKFKIDREDTDWEREYLGERFYNEINKEVER